MNPQHVHTLHFASRDELSWAFERLVSAGFVEDCLVESERLQIRFVAAVGAADPLLSRIYDRGGLTWSTRSPFGLLQNHIGSSSHSR